MGILVWILTFLVAGLSVIIWRGAVTQDRIPVLSAMVSLLLALQLALLGNVAAALMAAATLMGLLWPHGSGLLKLALGVLLGFAGLWLNLEGIEEAHLLPVIAWFFGFQARELGYPEGGLGRWALSMLAVLTWLGFAIHFQLWSVVAGLLPVAFLFVISSVKVIRTGLVPRRMVWLFH